MGQNFWKVIAALGGAATLFYALGFTVVQSYVLGNGFDGIFLFSKEFYSDAGASFILDLIRVPILASYVFFPYLLILLLLLPKEKNLLLFPDGKGTLSKKQWAKTASLMAIMVVTGLIALYYGSILKNENGLAVKLINFLTLGHRALQQERSTAFFCLVSPIVVILAIFLYRYRACLKPGSKSREIYGFILVIYFIFVSIIPITYGYYLYDLRIVPIKDPYLISSMSAKNHGTANDDMSAKGHGPANDEEIWLIRKFSDRYFFLRKVEDSKKTRGIIEVYDIQKINHLNFDIERSSTLKDQIKQCASEKMENDKWVLEDFAEKEVEE